MAVSWEIVEDSSAPVDDVWALLADARGWSRWARFSHSELLHEGRPVPDGVGALRSFGTGPFRSQEEVVEFEPPGHLAYEIRKGMPITGYRADVHLEPRAGGGTTIRWSSSFDHARPAWPTDSSSGSSAHSCAIRHAGSRVPPRRAPEH